MPGKSFSGGYRFRNFKGQPENRCVELALPKKVSIPLTPGFAALLEPKVKVNDRVFAGEIIARNDFSVSSPVHYSINGKVTAIEVKSYFKQEVTMIVIEGDGGASVQRIEGCLAQWDKLSAEKIEELLYKSGVTALDQGIPTRFKSSLIMPADVEDLIIHGTGSDVYNSSLELFIDGGNLFHFVEGIKILKKIMPRARVQLVLNSEKQDIIEKIRKITRQLDEFEIIPVIAKYPQGRDKMLIHTVLNKKCPAGYSIANMGIVVLTIPTVWSVYEATAEGRPLIERVIALSGPGFKENLHLKIRIGTALEDILKNRLKNERVKIILNSLLGGVELPDWSLPIDHTAAQLIAIPEEKERKFFAAISPQIKTDSYSRTFFSCGEKIPTTSLTAAQRPCIQCGYCLEVCPVKIMPLFLYRQANLPVNEELKGYGIFDCIDCNLCTYVCPAKIPLAEKIAEAKKRLIENGIDKNPG
ncbi:MAG: 4Fe-4S dicluster domain-containing protein [Candidatus Omnitrophota bacterium]